MVCSENSLDVVDLTVAIRSAQGYSNAVDNISFHIPRGKTFALVGESGCGKSLTALAINQLLPAAARYGKGSQIKLAGQDVLQLSELAMRPLRGRQISMIFQEPMTSLNPVMTIGQQIREVLQIHTSLSRAACQQRAVELLTQVGITDPVACYSAYPHQLSGGMKQRAMIAIGLAAEPDLLIADEPTTALDVTIQAQILALLQALRRKNDMSLLLITHDLGVVAEVADYIGVMYAGKIVEQASVNDFFARPLHPYSQKLLSVIPNINKRQQRLAAIPGNVPSLSAMPSGCRFAARCEHAWSLCQTHYPATRQFASQHTVNCHLYSAKDLPAEPRPTPTPADLEPVKPAPVSSQPLLCIEHLKVYFPIKKGILQRQVGAVKAVDDVSLQLVAGTTLALVGESGSGKSTLGKAVLRLIQPTAGRTVFAGVDLAQLSSDALRRLRKDIQVIFQDPYSALNPRMVVRDIIAEGLDAHQPRYPQQRRERKIDRLLDAVGLPMDSKDRFPHEFSGGQRQRICIARALAVKPKLIICDEPTSALDLSVQAQILNLLRSLQREFKLSYLFITHNISVVGYLADEVAVMYAGRIVEQGKVHDVLHRPQHSYTKKLLSAVPEVPLSGARENVCIEKA